MPLGYPIVALCHGGPVVWIHRTGPFITPAVHQSDRFWGGLIQSPRSMFERYLSLLAHCLSSSHTLGVRSPADPTTRVSFIMLSRQGVGPFVWVLQQLSDKDSSPGLLTLLWSVLLSTVGDKGKGRGESLPCRCHWPLTRYEVVLALPHSCLWSQLI